MKKIILWIVCIVGFSYLLACFWFYKAQDKLLFKTVKHPQNYKYHFTERFKEHTITMRDGKKLSGVLFKADSSKGLILWLPGGRGMLDSIGNEAKFFTAMHYDVFMLNFRGFGKSEGSVKSEEQFNDDLQMVYNYFKQQYQENSIVVFGYSLSTGPAARLASVNKPKMLILQAPYYKVTDLAVKPISFLPVSLLFKYKFNTFEHIQKVKSPIVIIHGDADERINLSASLKMKKFLKTDDELIILKGQKHNNFIQNPVYLGELRRILR